MLSQRRLCSRQVSALCTRRNIAALYVAVSENRCALGEQTNQVDPINDNHQTKVAIAGP